MADAAAPGTVDAPVGALVVSALVISAAVLLLFSFGLKPGTDAAINMQVGPLLKITLKWYPYIPADCAYYVNSMHQRILKVLFR